MFYHFPFLPALDRSFNLYFSFGGNKNWGGSDNVWKCSTLRLQGSSKRFYDMNLKS